MHRLFPLAVAASDWLGRRFSAAGRLLLGVLVASAILGLDIRQTLAYQLAALAFALLATAFVCSLRWRPALHIRRILPAVVTAGQSSVYWVEVTNLGRAIERDLLLDDRLHSPSPRAADFQRRHDDAATPVNWFDRVIGFPRWLAARRRARGADTVPTPIPALAPGATARLRLELHVLRRGWLRFDRIDVLRPDPLGLCRSIHRKRERAAVLALPRRHPMPLLGLQAERRYQRGGISLATAVGDSQEFAALRDYRPGDARRHIHWRSFARTGQLIVKEYQDEYFDRHALVVDTCLPAAAHHVFEAVIEVAASVAGGPRPRDSILDLMIAGSDIVQLSAGRGLGDGLRPQIYLAEAQLAADGGWAQMAALLRERMQQLASVVLVLGHWDTARQALVAELARRSVAFVSIRVIADSESDGAAPALGAHRHFTVRAGHLAADLARVELPP